MSTHVYVDVSEKEVFIDALIPDDFRIEIGTLWSDTTTGLLKRCTSLTPVTFGAITGGGSDTTAIHDDTAGEIALIAEKNPPISGDLLIIEDSADSNAKKKVQVGNLSGVIDHGNLLGLVPDDDHTQYALLAGRAGGQSIFGGTGSLEEFQIRGTTNANLGFIRMQAPVIFDGYTANPNAAYAFNYDAAEPTKTVGFVGGGLNMSGSITFTNSTFIYESFRGSPVITTGTTPGFSAYTVLQALPNLKAGSSLGHHPLSPLIVNAGATVENNFGSVRTVNAVTGMNFASALKTTASGGILNNSRWVGIVVAPLWNCVGGSTVSFGTIIGIDVVAPAQQLFGSGGGARRMTAYYGLQVANPTINNGFGTAPCAAVRSVISAGTNRFFLLNAGTAPSYHGAAHMYFDDNFGVVFGGTGISNFNAWISWRPGLGLATSFASFFDSIYQSMPAPDRFIWTTNGGNSVSEFNFDCHKFSLGAQLSAVGNQVGVFAAGTRATNAAGGWADFLLTQAGNLTINHAMGAVSAWTINAPSIVLGTGSVSQAITLEIGGGISVGTERYGVLIRSNPSGGTLNYALRCNAGDVRFDSDLEVHGDLDFISAGSGLTFGEISATDNAVATAIGVAGTPVQVTIFNADGLSNQTTPDHTSDDITIDVAGIYLISVSATVNSIAGAASRFEISVQKNNGASEIIPHMNRNIGGGGASSGVVSISGFASLAATDTVEVWLENETNTQNYVVEDISLAVMKVGA